MVWPFLFLRRFKSCQMTPKDKALFSITIVAICLLLTAILPIYCKTLFVSETGRFTIMPLWLAITLIVTLLFKIERARKIVMMINIVCIAALWIIILTMGFNDLKIISHFFLIILQLASLIALTDKNLKNFLADNNSKFDFIG
jgi:hypothetical protein